MASGLDLKDRELLNIIQSSFPLVEEPFLQMAESLGLEESDVIRRIERMKAMNVVRQISAIFDTRRLGYKTMLIAMKFAPEDLDAAAQVINQHPGVSHNYARNGHYNLWFTLAEAPDASLEDTVARLADEPGGDGYRLRRSSHGPEGTRTRGDSSILLQFSLGDSIWCRMLPAARLAVDRNCT